MDEPARKRRKTTSPEARERESSPLKKPPRRPSFASPTKASIARNYPNLIQRPTSSGSATARPISRSGLLARVQQTPAPVLDEEVEEEPELPTTPSHKHLAEKDTPRRGILFSSPSKRPPRVKEPIKQSPIRPKTPPVQQIVIETPIEETVEDELSQGLGEKKRIPPPDPELEKRKHEKARLEHEIEELEAQVSQCVKEITVDQDVQVLSPQERDDLIAFVGKISSTEADEDQPAPVSNLLCSFLPFSSRIVPPPRITRPEKAIPSHQPLNLDNPLPYLEMFTSFKFTTRLGLPRKKYNPSSSRVLQKHTIDITGPSKLLSASLSVTIDTVGNKISDLQVLQLSAWSERELGIFIRKKAQERDLGNICWAIASYWEIARKRAEYWHKCEQSFAQLIPGHSNEDTENLRDALKSKPSVDNITRKDLNRHLGRDLLVLQDKHVLLKLAWQIDFDWTGEAGSIIKVEPAFPLVWSEADASNSFAKVPTTFNSLLQTRGAFEATRILVALLFSGS